MKPLFMVLVIMIVFASLAAAPLRNIPTEVIQPDGKAYACFMTGDEYYHRYHDGNGYTIVKNLQTEWYVYAQKQGLDLAPTSFVPGVDDPALRGLMPNLMPDTSLLRTRMQVLRSPSGKEFGRSPSMGTVNNICIFIRFSDQAEFTDPLATYNTLFNSTTGASVHGYFLEESNNQLTVATTFYPAAMGGIVRSYQDPNPHSYYQPQSPSNPGGYPPGPPTDPNMIGNIRLHTMLVNAVNMVSPTIPPQLNIDADMDGSVDNIGFICQGAPDGWSDVLWPHYWVLDAYAPPVPLAYINGKLADDYNFELQVGLDTAVICHEFSHTMGFPDLYHYSFDGLDPCGYWDLMDWCLGTPQHHLTYMKWKYGHWFGGALPLPASGSITLNAVANNPFDCYMYQMPT